MVKKALPVTFLNNMKEMFDQYNRSDEYPLFLDSFMEESVRGIRWNSLKIQNAGEFEALLGIMAAESDFTQLQDENLRRVPWSSDGYYIPCDFFPGKHPFYQAGLFYIQEPSAMLPAFALQAEPGDHVLDLCAAPGGKTVKIAADLQGKGILFSNDINEVRVKALVRNVELAGCTNCVVLNESPANIAKHLPGYFDKILLDAPCSGEGMFRRDPDAISSWEYFGNDACVKMQREILESIDILLKPGGILVYSTCTFSTREDEEMIQWFLERHPDFEVLEQETIPGVDSGLSTNPILQKTCRILPHHAKGEGHFCAKLRKGMASDCTTVQYEKIGKGDPVDKMFSGSSSKKKQRGYAENNRKSFEEDVTKDEFLKAFSDFSKDVLTTECVNGIMHQFNQFLQIIHGHVYSLPEAIPSLDGLRIAKKGLYIGTVKKVKNGISFEPSHSFLLSRTKSDLIRKINFSTKDPGLMKYLKGETIFFPATNPADPRKINYETGRYVPVCVEDYPIGWGKGMAGDMVKNLYPQGWRKQV